MVYGMTRHGTNWRLIAETLLISRNASQIANRFKNVNARRRNVDDVPLEGLADMQQQQAQPGPSGQAAPLRRSRALLPAPAARTDRQPSGTTVGSVGAYMGQAAGPCALARHGVLQTATAVSAAGAAAGGSAGWAAVAPSSLPPAAAPAAVMQATRAVGLQPAIAAATIMQAKKQVRPQPQVAIPPVRVPLSVALQLVAQLQASGGLSGPAAATVSLLAAQLQVPSTTPVDIGALLRAIQQAIPQPATNTSAPVVGALGAMGKLPAGHLATSTSTSAVLGPGLQGAGTSYGQRSGATGGELGAPSMVALVAQLLRRAGVSQTSTLTLPVPQQVRISLMCGFAHPLPITVACGFSPVKPCKAPCHMVSRLECDLIGRGPRVALLSGLVVGCAWCGGSEYVQVSTTNVGSLCADVCICIALHAPQRF